jgi:hypothetical protein
VRNNPNLLQTHIARNNEILHSNGVYNLRYNDKGKRCPYGSDCLHNEQVGLWLTGRFQDAHVLYWQKKHGVLTKLRVAAGKEGRLHERDTSKRYTMCIGL